MCIAIYKPAGTDVPTKETLKICFENNPDGAGFMFASKGKVHIEKGLMTYSAFKKAIKKVKKIYEVEDNFKSLPMVFHFRISTQGGVNKALCHPFALSNSYDTMKELSGDYDMAIAHNGIIDFASDYKITDHNDTMEFIKEVAYPTINDKLTWYKKQSIIDMFEYLLSGNRVVVLGGDGHAELIGSWIEDGGLFYSNSSYKEVKFHFSKLSDYELYEWNKSFGVSTTKKSKKTKSKSKKKSTVVYTPLNEKQKEDLRYLGRMYCSKCGAWLEIAYDNSLDTYYAYCPDCAEFYSMDDYDIWDAIQSGAIDNDDEFGYYEDYYNFTKQGA